MQVAAARSTRSGSDIRRKASGADCVLELAHPMLASGLATCAEERCPERKLYRLHIWDGARPATQCASNGDSEARNAACDLAVSSSHSPRVRLPHFHGRCPGVVRVVAFVRLDIGIDREPHRAGEARTRGDRLGAGQAGTARSGCARGAAWRAAAAKVPPTPRVIRFGRGVSSSRPRGRQDRYPGSGQPEPRGKP